jgi:hypothetical protein
MTTPSRDPIIYTGAPIKPAIGRWVHLHRDRVCALGGEVMGPDTAARWRDGLWECREHVEQTSKYPAAGPDTSTNTE